MAKTAYQSPQPRLPDPVLRTILTLAIIVHLTALVVALSGYTEPSPLQSRLLVIFGPYLNPLNFNVNHTYAGGSRWHLTHATNADTDFEVVVEAKNGAGSPTSVVVPPQGIQPRIRRQRYQTLANVIGSTIGNDSFESVLPRTLAGSILQTEGNRQGTLMVRARMPSLQEVYTADGNLVDPFNKAATPVYEAQVLAQAGQIEILKKPPAAEVAPASPRK